MTKSKKKSLILALVFGLLFVASTLISGCYYMYYDTSIWQSRGFLVNKIIYTDDLAKYYDSSKDAYYMDGNKIEYLNSNMAKYVWSDKPGYVDVIVDTNENPVGFGAEGAYLQMKGGEKKYVLFNNSHIFSSDINALVNQGEWVCDDEGCTGPADVSGCMCGGNCMVTDVYITSDTALQYDEIMERLGITDEQTFGYRENFEGNTYTYTKVYNNHSHGTHYVYSINYQSFDWWSIDGKTPEWKNDESLIANTYFSELIIDGYDFSVLSNFLDSYDYSGYFDGDASRNYISHNDNFSYMFSNLPVEKITIKNVTGLGDNVKSIAGMFENCTNLKTVEFGNLFDNIKPTNISRMFYNCPSLEYVDLSKLDTSNVTNMDYMFATPYGLKWEEREQIINDFINEVVVPMIPELDQTIEYDLEMATQIAGMTKEEVLMELLSLGLNVPMTYDDVFTYRYDKGLGEVSYESLTSSTPLEPWFPSGAKYDTQQLVSHMSSMWLEAGFTPDRINWVYDGFLKTNGTREELVNYIINDIMVAIEPELNDGTVWTIDTLAAHKGISPSKLIYDVAFTTGFGVPLTFEEMCLGAYNMTFDEVVTQANDDPSVLNWETQIDESQFTVDEVKTILQMKADLFKIKLMSEEQLAQYNNIAEPVALGDTKIVFGGTDSKFVVKQGLSATKIFAGNRRVSQIVAPTIDEGASFELQANFTTGEENGSTNVLTSDSSGKTMYYYIENYKYNEDTPPATITTPTTNKGGLGNTLKTALIMIGSAVAVIIVTLVATLVTKRKR